ncbi:mediator of RNA polymerase II transcription subunit 1-like [Brachionichthys hirsutus]|uniref:mediator of RNA polymerase II transcription subunit 1-like n=1 Tax=Brachionichthys hirsutus TaxID=412623 RepID=UPI0036047B23
MSDLRLKFADKSWNETFNLVRRCMEKSRGKSKPSELLVRSLETLQEAFNDVSSLNLMKSRLEIITKQQGMGFHVTEPTCYLTADLFYLEVELLPCGGAAAVKVASHGRSPVHSESLLQMLRSHQFTEFSMKLAGLHAQYDLPGDHEIKLRMLASLRCLWEDLQQMSKLQPEQTDRDVSQLDAINNSRIGRLMAEGDSPLTIQFYIGPTDAPDTSDFQTTDPAVQAAQVTLVGSDGNHRLQVASVLPRPPQLDPQGCPVFLPPGEALHETLPACFHLKLQPPIPMTGSFIQRLGRITDVAVPELGLQWAPFPKVLMTQSANGHEEMPDEQDAAFAVPLPGGPVHGYVLPGCAWEAPATSGAAVGGVPFSHPACVPAVVELLRRQCVLNALLRSCLTSQPGGSGSEPHHEVLPESESSFSVTFRRPDTDGLAVLLVNVFDSRRISCTLFGAGSQDPSVNEYLSAAMTRCMSVPGTMMALNSKLTPPPSVSPPPGHHAGPSIPTVTGASDASRNSQEPG